MLGCQRSDRRGLGEPAIAAQELLFAAGALGARDELLALLLAVRRQRRGHRLGGLDQRLPLRDERLRFGVLRLRSAAGGAAARSRPRSCLRRADSWRARSGRPSAASRPAAAPASSGTGSRDCAATASRRPGGAGARRRRSTGSRAPAPCGASPRRRNPSARRRSCESSARLGRHQNLAAHVLPRAPRRRRETFAGGLGTSLARAAHRPRRLPQPPARPTCRSRILSRYSRAARWPGESSRTRLKAALAGSKSPLSNRATRFVEDLLDFALALGLELARLLDAPRRLLMVDVDQEDPRPGVDGGLVLAAIAGRLAAVEQLRDAHRVLAGCAGFPSSPPLSRLAEGVVVLRQAGEREIDFGKLEVLRPAGRLHRERAAAPIERSGSA